MSDERSRIQLSRFVILSVAIVAVGALIPLVVTFAFFFWLGRLFAK